MTDRAKIKILLDWPLSICPASRFLDLSAENSRTELAACDFLTATAPAFAKYGLLGSTRQEGESESPWAGLQNLYFLRVSD